MATNNSVNTGLANATGTGKFVGDNTPTLITPVLGVATATSINKMAITAPATSSTLAVADGKTLTASNTLTFTGTDSSSVNFGGGGSLFYNVAIQVFTANGTYTPTAGMKYCIVEAVGGGGGGGGAATTTSSQVAAAAGGGAGEYARSVLSAADIGASKAVVIGAFGAGGSAGANAGSDGADTTLGTTLVVAKGGKGGGAGTATGTSATATGGAGGTGGTGTLLIAGGAGQGGIGVLTATSPNASGGWGGNAAQYGIGGRGLTTISLSGGGGAGASAAGKGGGGAGGANNVSATQVAGGNGTNGIMIITEFF